MACLVLKKFVLHLTLLDNQHRFEQYNYCPDHYGMQLFGLTVFICHFECCLGNMSAIASGNSIADYFARIDV